MRPGLADSKRWGRAPALMCSIGRGQGVAGCVCYICRCIKTLIKQQLHEWSNTYQEGKPCWPWFLRREIGAQGEAVWQLSWCQKIARLLVPLPLLQVYWAVALVLVFPKGYGSALQSISLLKRCSHQRGTHRHLRGQWNDLPGAVQTLAYFHTVFVSSRAFPPLRLLQSSCIVSHAGWGLEKWCKKSSSAHCTAPCGFSSVQGLISHLWNGTWQQGDAAELC